MTSVTSFPFICALLFAISCKSCAMAMAVSNPGLGSPKNESRQSNIYAESSIASGSGISKHEKEEGSNKLGKGEKSISLGFKPVKRDVEQEADSANGKTPLYLFKKDFQHPNTRRFLSSSTVNEKGMFSGFPPFNGEGIGYQRQRRSFQSDAGPMSLSAHAARHPNDELDFQLDNQREKEAFLRLMALLASKDDNNYNNLWSGDAYPYSMVKSADDEDEGSFQDDELPVPIDLGYYVGEPDVFSANAPPSFYNRQQQGGEISPKDLGAYGLYLSPQYQNNKQDDDWMDDAVPLQSHLKTRRSDDSLFRYNPAKSHFRRVTRTQHGQDVNDLSVSGGRFGPFYP